MTFQTWRKTILLALIIPILASSSVVLSAGSDDEWPNWRGPNYTGVARTGAPINWSTTAKVKWKRSIPGKGHSTPIIWKDRIYLTTAVRTSSKSKITQTKNTNLAAPPRKQSRQSGHRRGRGSRRGSRPWQLEMSLEEHRFEVLCLDKNTGNTIWQRTATVAIPHEGYHRRYGSFSSNSPVTDGRHVYAFFGSRGLYVYDLGGNLSWKKDLGIKLQMRNAFGEGTAPVLHKNSLILNSDHEGQSFILALDKITGKQLWRKTRDERSTWTTPLVIEYKGVTQVVVTGTNRVRSYNISNGNLIWECGGLGSNPIPIPVRHRDTVIVMTGHRSPNMMAIRLGGQGDLTNTDAVLWTNQRGNAYTASPVYHDNKLYVLTDRGMISCFNASTGKPYYHQQRLPSSYQFKASPVGAAGKLYLASEQGDVIVLKMGEKYEVLAVNSMPEHFFISSPVIVDNELFLRSQNSLYCISEKSPF